MKLKDWLNTHKGLFTERDQRFVLKQICAPEPVFLNVLEWELTTEQRGYLEGVTYRYRRGIPLAYIVGKEEFYGFEFDVDPYVLIPRPETELLVSRAIRLITDKKLNTFLDLGCGSGNIAISIKKYVPKEVVAYCVDISLPALMTAGRNAAKHGIDLKLVNANWLSASLGSQFDLIVCNPPYVADRDINGSLCSEPRQALAGGEDGLKAIDLVLTQGYRYLTFDGYLLLEMGYDQRQAVEALLNQSKVYTIVDWIKDYAGHWRGVVVKRNRYYG